MENNICGDCGQEITRHYVLSVATWYEQNANETRGNSTGYSCAECVEKALGRKLETSDFNLDAEVNYTSGFLRRVRHWLN